ncbi:MAG: ABC transporter transmembrane domain-containing protein, partial [Gammaproteobacteria bacterium]
MALITATQRAPLRRALPYLFCRKPPFAGMIFCMLMVAVLEPLLPMIMKPLLDAGGEEFVIEPTLLPYFSLVLVLMLGAFSYGREYLGGWLDATMQRDLRAAITAHLLQLPLRHLRAESLGKTTSRFMCFVPLLT